MTVQYQDAEEPKNTWVWSSYNFNAILGLKLVTEIAKQYSDAIWSAAGDNWNLNAWPGYTIARKHSFTGDINCVSTMDVNLTYLPLLLR
jgi:hypothetical protein